MAYLLTAFGLPMPAGRAGEGPACGCARVEECSGGKCCCGQARPGRSCCTGKPGCTMPCCQHGTRSESCPHDGQTDEAPTGGVRWVPGVSAMKCRGQSTLWVSTGVTLPAPSLVDGRPQLDHAGWLPWSDDFAYPIRLLPPDPPPRSMAA